MSDRTGQQFGNYRLIALLGEGGFAEVYLGEHVHLGTQAAIKVLRTQLTGDDFEQFRTEARMIAHLEHPNIVRVLDFGVENTTPFLAMSYAPNGTLRQHHPKGGLLPPALIVTYVRQVAAALQYAHNERLIHRDVKPENMLIGRRSEVLLSDFGIALVVQSTRYQKTQEVIGTVAYMAPEQLQGRPCSASDQYALGIVTYEWLSGTRPFHGSFTEVYSQHMFVAPPPLHEKLSGITPAIESVVFTALAKSPSQRFENIQAFANALEQAVQSASYNLSPTVAALPQLSSMNLVGKQLQLPSVVLSQNKFAQQRSEGSFIQRRYKRILWGFLLVLFLLIGVGLLVVPFSHYSALVSSNVTSTSQVAPTTNTQVACSMAIQEFPTLNQKVQQNHNDFIVVHKNMPYVEQQNQTFYAPTNTVNIYDRAGVLTQGCVRSEASSLSYPIDIYTVNNFSGSTSSFDQTAVGSVNSSNKIVIAIDTMHRHLAIVGGSSVLLSNSQYVDARNAFASSFQSNNNYTSATIAAIRSLQNALGSSSIVMN